MSERAEEILREKEEDWAKPAKHAPIAHFCEKHGKGAESDAIRNGHDGFTEDAEIGNAEDEEESVGRVAEDDEGKQKQK